MSKQTIKTERFELRLRPNIPAEAALLSELEAQNGVYGGKTELLRECLRRGFTALGAAVDALPQHATEEEILDALASQFQAGEYSYRIGKLFLDARALVAEQAKNSPMPSSRSGSAAAKPVDTPAPRPEAHESAALTDLASSVQPAPENQPAVAPSAARPAADWARLRGIAGSGDGSSEKK